jgi:hypothetical protein
MLVIYISSCQSLQPAKTKSQWYQLQQTTSSDCMQWPLRDGDLRIDEVIAVKGYKPGFLVSGLRRNNSPFAYFSEYKSGKPAPDEFRQFQINPGQRLIGAHSDNGQLVIASAINTENGSKVILQNLANKETLAEKHMPNLEILDGKLVSSRNGFWLLLESSDHRTSAMFAGLGKGPPSLQSLDGASWVNQPTLVPSGAEPTALVIWQDDASQPRIHTQVVRESGTALPSVILPLETNDLEGWAATARNQRLYVALVEGDTMVGEAQLKITTFRFANSGFIAEKSTKFAINDVHTSAPLFLDGSEGLELVLLNWIDEESTIARYLVTSPQGSKPRFSGVFPKGLRIMGQLAAAGEGDFVVTRHRSGLQWIFQQCRI